MPNNELTFLDVTEQEVRQIFGPGSDSRRATELARRDPRRYAVLKQHACFELGIIPEEMLPLNNRIKPDVREAMHKAKLAAEKDALIPLSQELSDRLGLPLGSRVTFAQLQATLGRRVE